MHFDYRGERDVRRYRVFRFHQRLEVVNLFKYWNSAATIDPGTVAGSAWFMLGGVALASLIASVFVFSRRDVT